VLELAIGGLVGLLDFKIGSLGSLMRLLGASLSDW